MKSAIIAAIVALLVSATSATAAFVVTSKNIKNGTIQTVDISAKAKRALKGNRGPRGFQGAPGLPGPTGLKGDKGDKGDIGPSNGYEAFFCSDVIDPVICADEAPVAVTSATWSGSTKLVMLEDLPGGSYVVNGEVTILAHEAPPSPEADWLVRCDVSLLYPDGHGFVGTGSATAGGDVSQVSIPITFGAQLSGPATVNVACIRTGGSGAAGSGPNPKIIYADVTLLKVGSVTFG